MQHAGLREAQIQAVARARDRHIHQSSLFFHTFFFANRIFMREQSLLQTADENHIKFQPFG